MTTPFQTLQQPALVEGTGLHTGVSVRVVLRPRAEAGVLFARSDLPGSPSVTPSPAAITQTVHATTLEGNGATLSTTEHLLAALVALNVTNCLVEVDGPEIPILDGSAKPWCDAIADAGLQSLTEYSARPRYALHEPVWVQDGDAFVLGLPHPEYRLSVAVDFGLPYAGRQAVDLVVTPENFTSELAPARTFARSEWLAPLRAQGLIKGGSIENAILLDESGPSTPWRMENELAHHKALDVVGDLALLTASDGGVLCAHIVAVKAGHPLHRRWMEKCLEQNALIVQHG